MKIFYIFLLISVGLIFYIPFENVEVIDLESFYTFFDSSKVLIEGPPNETLLFLKGTKTYTSSTEESCLGNICGFRSYGGTRFAKDEGGNWRDAGRVTSITQDSDDLSFNYFGEKGNKSIVFETGSIYNGNYFSMQQVKQNIPNITFSFPVNETPYGNKYTLNIMNIPEVHQPNINFITLTYKSHSGFDASKLDFRQRKMIAGEIMNLLFDDAQEEGFTIFINKTEKRIYIGNITANIKNNTISIDPTVSLTSETYVDVAGFRRDAPTTGFGESTAINVWFGSTPPNAYRGYLIRFKNISGQIGLGATILDARVNIRASVRFTDGPFWMVRVLRPWVEGNGTGTSGTVITGQGGVTDTNWDELAGSSWTAPSMGCLNDDGVNNTYAGSSCDQADRRDGWSTPEDNITLLTANTWYDWQISNRLINGWYNGTYREDGVMITGNNDTSDYIFLTDDDSTFPPYLYIAYKTADACGGGICKFDDAYSEADIGLEQASANPPQDQGIQIRWDVSELCATNYSSVDSALMQFFISTKTGSPSSDADMDLVLNQTWAESDTPAQINGHPLQNATNPSYSSTTVNTFTNISVLFQIREACNRGEDKMTVRFEDPAFPLSTVADTNDVTEYLIGTDNLFSPPDAFYKFDSRENTNVSRRPSLHVTYTDPVVSLISEFIFPTPLQEKVGVSTIVFNMTLNETCGTGKDALIIRINEVNNTICSSCPLSPGGNQSFEKTGLADGNQTYDLLCNSAIHATNWTITDTGTLSTVFPISPGNASFDPTPASVEVSCNATSSSGIVNLTLWGDAHEIKNNFVILNSTNFTGGNENETASFIFQDILINDTYKWFCESESVVGNKKNASVWNIGVGISKVYMVVTIDAESDDRGSEDTNFFMNLSFSNYFINNLSETDSTFNSTWRADNNDSSNKIPKITWYMMTHESHCHATDKEGVLGKLDCNIIANIMYENSTVYSENFYYRNKILFFGDDYGWHNHHSFWNGTTTITDGGFWLGENEFVFQEGTNFFYDNFTNESSTVRAEKMVALFAYENALPWSSFRAGWAQTNEDYREFLSKNTPLDFGRFPIITGNFWVVGNENFSTTDLNRFRCNQGTPTQAQTDNAFEYATNTTPVVICGYSHNYGGLAIKNNIEVILDQAQTSSSSFPDVSYEWKTAKEAAQAYFRMTDVDAPEITITISGDNVVADFNELLYMAPALSILVNNGTTTNYSLQEMTKVNDSQYIFNKVNWENNTIGYRVRATDLSFNVNTSGFLESKIIIIEPTTDTPFIVSDQATISVNFKFFVLGEEQTTGVLVDSIFVNGTSACTKIGQGYYKSTTWEQNCTLPTTGFNETGFQNLTLTANHSLTPQINRRVVDGLNYKSETIINLNQGISIKGSSGKNVGFFKKLTESTNIFSNFFRKFSRIRDIIEEISINSIFNKIFGTLRNVNQDINIDSNYKGSKGFFRKLSESFSINSIFNKLFSGTRNVNQDINIDSNNQKQVNFFKKITSSFSINSIFNKIFSRTRNLNQDINIDSNNQKQRGVFSKLSESFSINSIFNKIFGAFRNINEDVVVETNNNRQVNFFKKLSEKVSINSIFKRFFSGTRNINQDVVVDTNYKVSKGFLIKVSESFSINSIFNKLFSGTRNVNQDINIDSNNQKQVNFFKKLSESFSINSIFNKLFSGTRNTDQDISIDSNYKVSKGFLIKVSESFSINSIFDKILGAFRNINEDVVVETNNNKQVNFFKKLSEKVSINSIFDKILGVFRNLNQDINIDSNNQKQRGVFSKLSEAFSINSIFNKLFSGTRNINEDVGVDTSIQKQRGVFSKVSESFSINSIFDKILGIFRNVDQDINIDSNNQKQVNFFKKLTSSFSINSIFDKLFSGTRNLNQDISIFDNLKRLFSGTRNINQDLNIDTSYGKKGFFTRTTIQDLSIDTFYKRIFFGFISYKEGVNIDTNYQRIAFFTITQSNEVIINSNFKKIFLDIGNTFLRQFSSSLNIFDNFNRFLDAKRGINQDVNVNTSFSRSASFIRGLIQNIFVFFRSIIPGLDIPDVPSGGGGGGTGSSPTLKDLNSTICNETYYHILEFGQLTSRIQTLQDKLEDKNIEIGFVELQTKYVNPFQGRCSEVINRTLLPDLVCNETLNFLQSNDFKYDNSDVLELKNKIGETLPISLNLMEFYIENYNDLCIEFTETEIIDPEKVKESNVLKVILIISFLLILLLLFDSILNKKKLLLFFGKQKKSPIDKFINPENV